MLWTPTALVGRGLQFWWDCAQKRTVSVDSANRVTSWRCRQSGVALAPRYASGPLVASNGALHYDGTNVGLQTPDQATAISSLSRATTFVVCKPFPLYALGHSPRVISYLGNGAVGDYSVPSVIHVMREPNAPYDWQSYRNAKSATGTNRGEGVTEVLTTQWSTGNFLRVGGVASASGVTMSLTQPGTVFVGTSQDGGEETFRGYIYEVLWFGVALPDVDIERIESYLAAKWGARLPVTHPYAARQVSAPARVLVPARRLVPRFDLAASGWGAV
jgi:hypothetical protein